MCIPISQTHIDVQGESYQNKPTGGRCHVRCSHSKVLVQGGGSKRNINHTARPMMGRLKANDGAAWACHVMRGMKAGKSEKNKRWRQPPLKNQQKKLLRNKMISTTFIILLYYYYNSWYPRLLLILLVCPSELCVGIFLRRVHHPCI